ncbi:MAG: beta-L-arabinofuranosidase domain-containing protein, partial [Capsulimonadaceae bacterium]
MLAATLPALAVFCLGRTPSRYADDNLPDWERRAPSPARMSVSPACVPQPASFEEGTVPVLSGLQSASEDALFVSLESSPEALAHGEDIGPSGKETRASGRPTEPSALRNLVKPFPAGAPGLWLEQAAAVAGSDPALTAKMDRVAVRLMNNQDRYGYLGSAEPSGLYTAADIEAHAGNLRGLVAYYRVSRQPAVIYAAMRAGDFLLTNYNPWPGTEDPVAEDSLVYALTRLYLQSGQVAYLRFAERESANGACGELGLCALFEATGDRHFLKAARESWWRAYSTRSAGANMEHASAELYVMTG